jgi:hypothetical protein
MLFAILLSARPGTNSRQPVGEKTTGGCTAEIVRHPPKAALRRRGYESMGQGVG